jgi:uncharacterized protein (TIGR02996 family)
MPENPELLNAVVENPDLDGPRLVYADWCATADEEDLRMRGELIRAQIDISHTSLGILNSGGAHTILLRIGELIERWAPVWAEPLRDHVLSSSFHRGFVGLVKMTAREFLANAETVFSRAPIQHLDLTGLADVNLRDLFTSPFLRRLRSLSLDRCGLESRDIPLLASSPSVITLRWLSLENNKLDLDGARALAAGPYLKLLRVARLSGNPVDPTEEIGIESGEVVGTWLPEAGEALEREFGPIRWLHWRHDNSRFD